MSKRYVEIRPGRGQEEGSPIKAWVRGVPLDPKAKEQLLRTARLPFVHGWLAVMPDVHWGLGATIGSVVPTRKAIVPAAVGVDIGCGMAALHTSLSASDLPDDLSGIRSAIEAAVPHGRTHRGGPGDEGSFDEAPPRNLRAWEALRPGYERIVARHPKLSRNRHPTLHLGTLGTGNHFIEVCLDEDDGVWVLLHSGSRGVGNRTGMHFIALAKKDMERHRRNLPDEDLAYLEEGSEHFDDYWHAVEWAQRYAATNRELMMEAILEALRSTGELPEFHARESVVNCHHNYVAREHHYGEDVYVTRKGAVRAGDGDLGIIPGSMGARSYIVRGKGNPESYESCSHGAGRVMSRNQARKAFTVEDHAAATRGVECRKDAGVLDETPKAYKDIDAVMEAQSDLVEIVHRLRQVVLRQGVSRVSARPDAAQTFSWASRSSGRAALLVEKGGTSHSAPLTRRKGWHLSEKGGTTLLAHGIGTSRDRRMRASTALGVRLDGGAQELSGPLAVRVERCLEALVGDVHLPQSGVHGLAARVVPAVDVESVLLRQGDTLVGVGRDALRGRRSDSAHQLAVLGLDRLPVLLRVALRAPGGLAVRLGLAPALVRLGLVLRGVESFEDLSRVHGLLLLERRERGVDRPQLGLGALALGREALAVLPQQRLPVEPGLVEHPANPLERKAELPEQKNLLQAQEVVISVEPIARVRARGRPHESDRVVVVERPDGDPGELRDLLDAVAIVRHETSLGPHVA